MRSSEIWLRKLKLKLRDTRFANHKAICQQPLQSVVALRHCNASDLFINLLSRCQRAERCFPWTDVTLSTSYNECHEWTSGWTSPMYKCSVTGRRKYAFSDPCVFVFFFFFMLWYVLPPLTILVTLVFSPYEQVHRTQKVCISGPMFIRLFSCFGGYYHLSEYSTLFNTLYMWSRVSSITL